jgi:hypothetical protein
MQHVKFPAFIIALCFSFNSLAQQTKIDVQTGQKFKVETSTAVSTSAEVMGQTMENNTDTKNTTMYEVKGAGQDGVALQATIIKLLVSATAMGQSMSFDSDKKDNEGPMADALAPTVNKTKNIILDTKGAIVKQDEDASAGAAISAMSAITSAFTTELFLPSLIGRELTAGTSFNDVVNNKSEKYNNRDSGTYTITAVENGIASISYTGTGVTSTVMEQMGMEMTSNSINLVKIEMQVDVKTGLVLAKATVIEMNISVDAGGMTIPATGKTITTVNVTPVQ